MNYTLINAEHDFNTHISSATISTDIGVFTATTCCRDEDIECESKFFGCRLAEWKALRLHAKAKKREAKAALDALTSYANRMLHTKNYKATDFYVKQLVHEIDVAQKKYNHWVDSIRNIDMVITSEIVKHDIAMQRFKKYGD